ncbi:MAG: acyl carrier protein [Acidobacteriaceae bacterium]|jgi:acyl carrier protein
MDERQVRLAGCFLVVFPELSLDRITEASAMTVQNWDSVAGVTLLSVVEEEFGITIEDDDLARFNSFNGLLNYLQQTDNGRRVSVDSQV